ncbi:hypothetical protein BEI46_03910 [Aliivibrio fischeri]|nr:hypothetical protein BEI46_03910 [Aliivibrio fischeri]
MIQEIRAERQEEERLELQRTANQLAKKTVTTARVAIVFSIIACIMSSVATIILVLKMNMMIKCGLKLN